MPPSKKSASETSALIGVGASAGGLEALTLFLSNLPKDFPHPIIVAQHLSPHAKSMLVELLAKQSSLPVETAQDRAPLKKGTIYIVPPNCGVRVTKDRLLLDVSELERRPIPSIDEFFNSLAHHWRDNAVGIILSGTGSDGAQGIRAIHAAGGLTLAQDGFSAKYDGMPQAAIDTSCIDAILSPSDMAKTLVNLLNEHNQERTLDLLSTPEWQQCLVLLQKHTGTDYSLYKPSTIQRRLWRRMLQVRVSNMVEYLEFLKRTPGEVMLLGQQLLVSVTSFFRDEEVFGELRKVLSEMVVNKKHGDELRVWVAGCATGEEAYSLAMMVADILEQKSRALAVKIFATDLDQDAIAEGRKGIYDAEALRKLPSGYLNRYFETLGNQRYEVNKRIRDIVVFARQDMIQNPPFVRLDLVTCRNVMIYFEPELQKKVLEVFHYALVPQGILCLGKSETPGQENTLFEILDKRLKIYRKMDVASSLQMNRFSSAPMAEYIPARRRIDSGPSMLERGLLKILKEYNHCGVIVDKDLNIIQVLGDISEYASFSSSQSDMRLISLIPKTVGVELPILLRRASEDSRTQHSRWYDLNEKKSQFRMAVRTMSDDATRDFRGVLFLISFESRSEELKPASKASISTSDVPGHILEIEQELFATREHLQTVIEELGVANEELQSLNEELSSTNEELQSANEELETANEELQSGNEELTTVNEELNMKSQQLREMNTSLENIQESIGAGLVVLDKNGCIVRFNQQALEVFSLQSSDIGKPIVRVSARCELPDFEKRILETIREGRSSDTSCDGHGVVYQLRCQPFYDESKHIVGATLIFIDETNIHKTREKLKRSEAQLRSILESFSGPVTMKDQHGRYLMVNSGFADFFGLEQKDVLGKTDQEIFKDRRATMMREWDLEVMYRGEPLRQNELITDKQGRKRYILSNRFPLYETRQDAPYAVGMIAVDITSQIEVQNRLEESESRYKAIIEDQAVFVCRMRPDGEVIYANKLFELQFAEGSDKITGEHFYDFLARQDVEKIQADISALSSRQNILQSEYRIFRKNGSPRWIRWIFKGIYNSDKELLEIQAIGFDITDYRTKTDQLLEKEAIFSKVLGNTTDIVTILYKDGNEFRSEYFNIEAERLLGDDRVTLGKPLTEISGAARAKRLYEKFILALTTNETISFEDIYQSKDKDVYFLYNVVPLRSSASTDGVDRVAVICKDISRHKNIEQDLRVAKESAEVANEAKSDFLASMSHELRTPLNVVLGMSTLLSETELSNEQKAFVGSIDRSGKALLSLIEDILDITKIEAGKIKLNAEVFDIADMVGETTRMFEPQASGKGIQLVCEVDPAAKQLVVGDPGRLRQVVVNLIGNAIKFTDKGQVTVRLRPGNFEYAGEKEFFFEVQDSGIGIKEADRGKIFKKFSQVESGHSRRFGGTGLGLVISKQITEMMKGDMGFDSKEGQGSLFWFSVRLLLASQKEIQSRSRRTQHIQKNSDAPHAAMRILAVDDNKESLNIIRLFLDRLGHQVYTASRGQEAIDIVRENPVDLVLMDVQMPEMNGYEATGIIRQDKNISGQLPIIALTANAMAGDADKCLQAGMNDYITKPIRLDTLKETLSRWSASIAKDQ